MNRYVYADLGGIDLGAFRLFGPGLGNLLFPWARATLYARKHGLTLLPHSWPQLKLGPTLRGEKDKRSYIGLFTRQRGTASLVTKISVLSSIRASDEGTLDSEITPKLIRFSGMNGLFTPIRNDPELIAAELWQMTRPEHRTSADLSKRIAVHVRLGDFQNVASQEVRSGRANSRIPLGWYRGIMEWLSKNIPGSVGFDVFTDGTEAEVRELLALPNTKLIKGGSALSDMWSISRARILIASGSTFSMWGSYLGQVPTIWHPGQLKNRVHKAEGLELEIASPAESGAALRRLICESQ